jgi:hypothetical protein
LNKLNDDLSIDKIVDRYLAVGEMLAKGIAAKPHSPTVVVLHLCELLYAGEYQAATCAADLAQYSDSLTPTEEDILQHALVYLGLRQGASP